MAKKRRVRDLQGPLTADADERRRKRVELPSRAAPSDQEELIGSYILAYVNLFCGGGSVYGLD